MPFSGIKDRVPSSRTMLITKVLEMIRVNTTIPRMILVSSYPGS